MRDAFYWLAVALVVITSAARLTRLATFDLFPPVKWLREKYAARTDGSDWQVVAYCGYCASFWLTALVVLTGLWAGVLDQYGSLDNWQSAWWIVNGTLGASYLAAILMAHDGDAGDEN